MKARSLKLLKMNEKIIFHLQTGEAGSLLFFERTAVYTSYPAKLPQSFHAWSLLHNFNHSARGTFRLVIFILDKSVVIMSR